MEFTDIHVAHSGSEHTTEAHQRKLERDFRILNLDLAERPDHPFVLFNLGMTHADAGEHGEAVEFLRRCLEVAEDGESIVPKAHALLVGSLTQLQNYEAAWAQCEQALKLFPKDQELWFRRGALAQQLERYEEAKDAYVQAIEAATRPEFSSMVTGLGSFKARHNLAMVYEALGNTEQALREWRQATVDHPRYRPAWQGWAALLLKSQRLEECCKLAERLREECPDWSEHPIIASRIHEASAQLDEAEDVLTSARNDFPDDLLLLQELTRFAFEHRGPGEAFPYLLEQTTRDSNDAAAWHNLGTAWRVTGQFHEAIEAYERSLELRPDSPETLRLLMDTLESET